MSDLKLELEPKQEAILRVLVSKSQPVNDNELRILRELFHKKLKALGKTQSQWCEENNISNANVSNSLSGQITSKPTVSVVARYVLDESWT